MTLMLCKWLQLYRVTLQGFTMMWAEIKSNVKEIRRELNKERTMMRSLVSLAKIYTCCAHNIYIYYYNSFAQLYIPQVILQTNTYIV